MDHDVCNIIQNPVNIGNWSLQHSLESWKYYPIPKPNPKPNPYPFSDPGRVLPGNAGGPGPGRRAGSQNPNPLGSCARRLPLGFLRGGPGSSVRCFYRHILLFLSQRHIFLTGYCFFFFNLVHPVYLEVTLDLNVTRSCRDMFGPRTCFFCFS